MLGLLISLSLFCLVNYVLWSLWCRHAPKVLSPTAPGWIQRPNFLIFFFLVLVFVLIYRGEPRR